MNRRIKLLVGLLSLIPMYAAAVQKPFRFVQMTDIHVSGANSSAMEDLRASVEQINAERDVDFVLITGDITDSGDRHAMETVKAELDKLKAKYYIIPGNHETKWSESGCTAFGDLFGGERFEFIHKGVLFLGFNSGPLMRMAYGHVVPQDIEWMTSRMKRAGRRRPVILVTHYPLMEGDVDNWYDVTDAVRPYNIRLVIGGHYHAFRTLSYDGIPGVLMRSNLRDKEGRPGYGIYEVDRDSIRVFVRRAGEPARLCCSLPFEGELYDRAGKADKYPDFSANEQYANVREQWIVQTGAGIYSSPALEDGRVFVGDDMGRLTAYELDNGKRLWQFRSARRIVGTPAASEGVVVFGSGDCHIYGLDSRNGRLLWKVAADEPVLGAVAIADGVAFVGASDHTFRAIDIHSGRLLWAYTDVKGYIETRPLITGDAVIFGAWDNTLYALDRRDGSELWRWTHGLSVMHYSPAAVWPVEADGKVFIADPQRALTAIDLKSGRTVWRTFGSMVRETAGVSEDCRRIYSKTMNDSMVCYSALGRKPVELWATDVGFGYEHAPSMHLEKDGVVFGSTKEGLVFALEGTSGRLLWKHKIGNSLINTVIPISGSMVLFTATGGELGLLKAD